MCLQVERRHCWWQIGIGLVWLLDDVVGRLEEEEAGTLCGPGHRAHCSYNRAPAFGVLTSR
jgi:hypothetical protein